MSHPVEIRPPERALLRTDKRLLFVCLFLGVLAPSPALAHVKWFTDSTQYPLHADLAFSDRTLLWLLTSTLAVVGLIALHRRIGGRDWPELPLFQRMAVGAPTILAIQAAIALISSAAHGSLLAPNLTLPAGPGGLALAGLEVAVAFTFITGIADWVGALALIGLVPLAAVIGSPLDAVEQCFWVGIGVIILVIGRGSAAGQRARPWFWRRDPESIRRAVACLRVATGISLIGLAVAEKLWDPELGRAFMADHGVFNIFHSAFGISAVSDDMFVLMIGLIEAAIGAALISGRLTRLIVLVGWLPFHVGIPLLPQQELVGHLPIFGIMYMLLVFGGGTLRVSIEPSRRARPISAPALAVQHLAVPAAARVRHVRRPAPSPLWASRRSAGVGGRANAARLLVAASRPSLSSTSPVGSGRSR